MGSYSINDITKPINISSNYLTPGLMTQAASAVPAVTTPAVTTPEVQPESTVGGYDPNPLPLCPIGQVRDHRGKCVNIQDYDGSREDEADDPFSGGEGQSIGKPWYEDADFSNLDDFISGKLAPSERQTGLANIVSNMPVVRFFSEGAKYNNISQSYAAAKLAYDAKQISKEDYDNHILNIQGYIKSERLNQETVDSFFQGDIRVKAAKRKFAGEDQEWTAKEWRNFTNSSTASPKVDSSGRSKPAPETPAQTDTRRTIAQNLQSSNNKDQGLNDAEKFARDNQERIKASKSSVDTSGPARTTSSGVNISGAQQKAGTGVGSGRGGRNVAAGPMNKGGLMKKKKKK